MISKNEIALEDYSASGNCCYHYASDVCWGDMQRTIGKYVSYDHHWRQNVD